MAERDEVDPNIRRLEEILRRAQVLGLRSLTTVQIEYLPALYRYASSELARLEARAGNARRVQVLRRIVARAHALLYRGVDPDGIPQAASPGLARATDFLLRASPRAIRAEWRLVVASLVVFYGLAAIAFLAVGADLEVAFSLLGTEGVTSEIEQLRATESGEPFRGNFDFGIGESGLAAGQIMANNIWVSVLFFGSALIPPLYLFVLSGNALMVGTYIGVAGHWGQAGAISSILWCHGAIELQMIILAGAAGLVLVRGAIMPGTFSRRFALQQGARRAWHLLAPVFPLLVISGLIEGYVSPHAGPATRIAVAVLTGALLLIWALRGGLGPAATFVQPSRQERAGGLRRQGVQDAHA
jgi:uncharacterized membrane protein SpoIIM required for sporulation